MPCLPQYFRNQWESWVKLPSGVTWDQLAAMTPDAIREQSLFPKGFLPLPHPKHASGGFSNSKSKGSWIFSV